MASTVSSTSSLTPADSASSIDCFRTPGPVDPDVRRHKGKTYRRVQLERPKKPRTGWWWGYGCEWDEADTNPIKYYWVCAVCESWHAIQTTSSQHIRDHLARIHRIADPTNTSQPSIPIRDAFTIQAQKREPTTAEALEARRKKVHKALLEWIAHDRIAFSAVESSHFQAFCEALDPAYATVIPSSHNSVRAWLITEFELKRAKVTARLAMSKSMVHTSFDLWTSPHKNMAVLGIVAHFMNSDYTNEATLLALRQIKGTHSGQNMAEAVVDTLQTYQIERLGYFVCDNASSNDTAILDILKSYRLAKEKDRRRLRCLGHIVNLAAQAFLFGKDTDAFEESDLEDLDIAYKLWQQAGPIGQVHFLVAFIRASSQRREDFTRLQGDGKGLQPLLENKTRWNSTWNMLKRAKQLRKAINLFCLQYIDSKDLDTSAIISDETWDLLDEICSILELFDYATEKLQGAAKDSKHGSLWECLPMIETLLKQVENLKMKYPLLTEQTAVPTPSNRKPKSSQSTSLPTQGPSSESFLAIAINNAWLKLDKYYTLTDMTEVYVAAVVLNPYKKWSYFEASWKSKPDWLATAKEKVRGLWEEYKDKAAHSGSIQATPDLSRQQKDYGRPDYLAEFERSLYAQEEAEDLRDEYDYYIEPGREKVHESKQLHPIRWWQNREAEYPVLSQLAFDLLSIPAMAAGVERVFSGTKELITDRRNALDIESIQANECFRNWGATP